MYSAYGYAWRLCMNFDDDDGLDDALEYKIIFDINADY